MKLDYHEHVTKHFENLTKKHETTLEILKDLKFKSDISENIKPFWGILATGAKIINIFKH
jgi:hypothetical protein